jgi:hypothetical protein
MIQEEMSRIMQAEREQVNAVQGLTSNVQSDKLD